MLQIRSFQLERVSASLAVSFLTSLASDFRKLFSPELLQRQDCDGKIARKANRIGENAVIIARPRFRDRRTGWSGSRYGAPATSSESGEFCFGFRKHALNAWQRPSSNKQKCVKITNPCAQIQAQIYIRTYSSG